MPPERRSSSSVGTDSSRSRLESRMVANRQPSPPLTVVLNAVKHPDSIGQVACRRSTAAGEG